MKNFVRLLFRTELFTIPVAVLLLTCKVFSTEPDFWQEVSWGIVYIDTCVIHEKPEYTSPRLATAFMGDHFTVIRVHDDSIVNDWYEVVVNSEETGWISGDEIALRDFVVRVKDRNAALLVEPDSTSNSVLPQRARPSLRLVSQSKQKEILNNISGHWFKATSLGRENQEGYTHTSLVDCRPLYSGALYNVGIQFLNRFWYNEEPVYRNIKKDYEKAKSFYSSILRLLLTEEDKRKEIEFDVFTIPYTLSMLAEAYIGLEHYDQALDVLRTIVEEYPTHPYSHHIRPDADALTRMAEVYRMEGYYERSIDLYHRIIRDFKRVPWYNFEHETTYDLLAVSELTQMLQKDIQDPERLKKELSKVITETDYDVVIVQTLNTLGCLKRDAGDYSGALEIYKRVLTDYPAARYPYFKDQYYFYSAQALVYSAEVYLDVFSDYEKTLELSEEVVDQDKDTCLVAFGKLVTATLYDIGIGDIQETIQKYNSIPVYFISIPGQSKFRYYGRHISERKDRLQEHLNGEDFLQKATITVPRQYAYYSFNEASQRRFLLEEGQRVDILYPNREGEYYIFPMQKEELWYKIKNEKRSIGWVPANSLTF